jgi:hypothetical protein
MLYLIAQTEDELGLIDQLVAEFAGDIEGSYPAEVILLRLLAAVLIGWLVGLTYRHTHTGKKMLPSMPHTLLLLCLGGALVWLVVGNNIARAFGLAGMVGLIRYRTRLDDPKDTTILLFSMIMGMACGLGQYVVAIIGSLTVLSTLWALFFVSAPEREARIDRRRRKSEQTFWPPRGGGPPPPPPPPEDGPGP